MIVELVCNMIFGLVTIIINLMPVGFDLPTWIDNLVSLVCKGLSFFPQDVWLFTLTNVIFWLTVHVVWAIVEWVYKKIPGVD